MSELALPWDYLLKNFGMSQIESAVKDNVDANYSIVNGNGVQPVSSNRDLTLALGVASAGADAWLKSNGNEEAYNQSRNAVMSAANLQKLALLVGATNNEDFAKSVKRNFDRGAATAKGLVPNGGVTDANVTKVKRGLVTKANEGYLFDTENKPMKAGDKIGGKLTAVGYNDAKAKLRVGRKESEKAVIKPSVGVR